MSPIVVVEDEIETRLVERDRVGRGEDADVSHLRLRRIAVTVAVYGKVVHDIDVEHLPAEIVVNGLRRYRNGQQDGRISLTSALQNNDKSPKLPLYKFRGLLPIIRFKTAVGYHNGSNGPVYLYPFLINVGPT